jgi:uncharacterized protein YxeA
MPKRIFILIAILVVVCLSSFVAYSIAYAVGNGAGYDKGYSAGKDIGYSSGRTYGYNSGKTDSYQEGVQAGLGYGYTIKDQNYDQALAFIKEDKTDENKYAEPTDVCAHFARDVCNNAEKKGIRCAFVEIHHPDSAHSIVAFNTIDKGLVYFEPQTDTIARPVIGMRFYQCVEPKPGYHNVAPSYDDTITDILVIW